ncbi:MAG: hypothetical protein ABIQ11_08885 [Saprospiraceae bacterium]
MEQSYTNDHGITWGTGSSIHKAEDGTWVGSLVFHPPQTDCGESPALRVAAKH